MELLILAGVGVWLAAAVRYSWRHRGQGCQGCGHECRGCGRQCTKEPYAGRQGTELCLRSQPGDGDLPSQRRCGTENWP